MTKVNAKNIFFLDGMGALVSALLLGTVLPGMQDLIGMPANALYLLAGLALIFSGYSFFCYIFKKTLSTIWITVIILLNSCYCVFTSILLFIHWHLMQPLGVAYFIGEIIIIMSLVFVELKIKKSMQ